MYITLGRERYDPMIGLLCDRKDTYIYVRFSSSFTKYDVTYLKNSFYCLQESISGENISMSIWMKN